MRVMLAVALLLLRRPVRAVTPKTVLTGDDLLKVVANAAYRSGSGANAATVNGPWLEKQLCVRGTQTCFMPLPRKAVEEVCSGKPCWQCDAALLSPGGSAGWGTRATDEKLSAYGYNARHIPSEVAWLSLTQGVDIVPFCALADGFGGIKPTPKKCTGTTALTLAAYSEQIDPVSAFGYQDCSEAIKAVDSALDEFVFWAQRVVVARQADARWSSMFTPSVHTLVTQLVPKLQRRFEMYGTCSVADISTAEMEYGHCKTKKVADKHCGRGGDQKGQGSWARQILKAHATITVSNMKFARMLCQCECAADACDGCWLPGWQH
eukprot:COSAG01_NODE_15275_length_1355_cov_1.861465_1_plen_321_part_00